MYDFLLAGTVVMTIVFVPAWAVDFEKRFCNSLMHNWLYVFYSQCG